MTAMVALIRRAFEVAVSAYDRKNDAERHKLEEYNAAVKIQSWVRGCRVRRYLQYLSGMATVIQKNWRGHLARRVFRQMVKESVSVMKKNYYNEMATKIQQMWRGFYVRKYVFSFSSRQRYFRALQEKNEIVRMELRQFAAEQRAHKKRMVTDSSVRHLLISTFHIPGIYWGQEKEANLPAMPLASFKPQPLTFTSPAWMDYHNKYLPPTHLPPLSADKPQGPFLDPQVVQRQRFRSPQPSLLLATDFYALDKARAALKADEWVHRVNDNIFQPFSQCKHRYKPLIHTMSPYTEKPLPFREDHPEKNVSQKPFKSQVPPFPTFDDLKEAYSRRQV